MDDFFEQLIGYALFRGKVNTAFGAFIIREIHAQPFQVSEWIYAHKVSVRHYRQEGLAFERKGRHIVAGDFFGVRHCLSHHLIHMLQNGLLSG